MSDARDDGGDERLPAVVEKGPPPIKIARDHASRQPREMVYVNAKGASTSSLRANAAVPINIGSSIALAAVGAVTWMFPVIMTGWLGWRMLQQRRLTKGNALTLHGRFDEAENVLLPLAQFPLFSPMFRNLARSTLALIRMRRSDYAGALVWAQKGARFGWPRLPASLCRGSVVAALINLDRVSEARAYFDRYRARTEPRGDLLRRGQWEIELYLALAEGKHSLDADELHRRAREALTVTTARCLIALLAWAHHSIGDTDQAWHLLREALHREDTIESEATRPRLYAWMEKHRAEALADAPADEET